MNKDKKLSGILVYVSILVVAIYILIYPYISKPHYGIDGFIDLSNESFDSSDTYTIGRYFKINHDLSSSSYQCYTLNALLPNNTDKISIYIPFCYASTCLYVNDSPVFLNKNLDNTYFTGPTVISIPTKERLVQMRLYIENNAAISPTFFSSNYYSSLFSIGNPTSILHHYNFNYIFMLTLAIISLISFFFHFSIYKYKQGIHEHFLLSLLCLTLFVSLLFGNQGLACLIFKKINNILALKITALSYLLRTLLFFLYIQSLCGRKFKKFISYSLFIACSSLLLAIIFAPAFLIYNILFIILILTYIYTLLCILMFTMGSAIDDTPKAKQSALVGFFSILLGNYWDIYQYLVPGSITSASSIFYIIYSFVQAMILSTKYNRTNSDIIKLTPLLNKAMDELQNDKSTYINTHIKPTFLYETMDSIDYYADKDVDKVDSLIQNLSKYLRQSLDFSINPEIYSLKKEISNSKAFAALVHEQLTRLKIVFNIPDNLPDTFVPQSSIISLIQNSIDHGFDEALQPQIDVTVSQVDEDNIEVKVSDNGSGMTKSEITYAMSQPGSDFGVGLFYIHQKLLARGSSGLYITSSTKTGTCISFILGIEDTSEVFPYDI